MYPLVIEVNQKPLVNWAAETMDWAQMRAHEIQDHCQRKSWCLPENGRYDGAWEMKGIPMQYRFELGLQLQLGLDLLLLQLWL